MRLGFNQLRPHIGRGINQYIGFALRTGLLDQKRTTGAAVLRVIGVAFTPIAIHTRHTTRRAAAQNAKSQAHAALGRLAFEKSV